MRHVSILAVSALVLASVITPLVAQAADVQEGRFTVDPKTEIAMPLGVTKVDFNFNGKPGLVISTYNDIQSAHNNFKYLFTTADWKTVMFETSELNGPSKAVGFPGIHGNEFNTGQGADFTTDSIHLFSDKAAKKTYAVVAIRDYGHSWVDSRPVTIELFTYTKLNPSDQQPGMAPEFFQLTNLFVTKKCYPDADFALFAELSLNLLRPEQDGRTKADMSKPCDKP
jgi:hypothetical protein